MAIFSFITLIICNFAADFKTGLLLDAAPQLLRRQFFKVGSINYVEAIFAF